MKKVYYLRYNFINPAKLELYDQVLIEEGLIPVDAKSDEDALLEMEKAWVTVCADAKIMWERYKHLINSPFYEWKPTSPCLISKIIG